jgi:hypothetical protein
MKEQHLQSRCQPDHGGVPIAIGMKVETKEKERPTFIIQLPAKEN